MVGGVGVVAVLLCVLWVRSYWWADRLGRGSIDFASARGVIQVQKWFMPEYFNMRSRSHWTWDGFFVDDKFNSLPGFHWHSDPISTFVNVPHWLLVLYASASSAVPWLPLKHFSLRTLLIATTLIAVILGAIVYAVK